MAKEIEVKYQLLNKAELFDWLNTHAEYVNQQHQIDTYYDNSTSSFIADKNNICKWLRIRQEENDKVVLNYKHWHSHPHDYADEYELEISSPAKMHVFCLH